MRTSEYGARLACVLCAWQLCSNLHEVSCCQRVSTATHGTSQHGNGVNAGDVKRGGSDEKPAESRMHWGPTWATPHNMCPSESGLSRPTHLETARPKGAPGTWTSEANCRLAIGDRKNLQLKLMLWTGALPMDNPAATSLTQSGVREPITAQHHGRAHTQPGLACCRKQPGKETHTRKAAVGTDRSERLTEFGCCKAGCQA